jgi:hypothetical protein
VGSSVGESSFDEEEETKREWSFRDYIVYVLVVDSTSDLMLYPLIWMLEACFDFFLMDRRTFGRTSDGGRR